MLFFVILHNKICGQPAKPRPGASPTRKLRPDMSHGSVKRRIFLAQNHGFFWPGPNLAWPVKCSVLVVVPIVVFVVVALIGVTIWFVLTPL
jgi:hypothetical protein